MVLISVRDALWRWRRFLVALAATAVVLSLTLVLDGVNRSFPNEARRTVAAFNADAWIIPADGNGVFLSSTVMSAATAPFVGEGGAEAASAVAILRAGHGEDRASINLIGVVPGLFTDPPITEGRMVEAPGEAVADRRLGVEVGQATTIDGRPFTIVGTTRGLTYLAGVATVYVPLGDAQALSYAGANLATAIAVQGEPEQLAPEFQMRDNATARRDLLMPLQNARTTISLLLSILWLVAAMVIGSVVYLTSVDRTRDFAVLKATGSTNASLLAGLGLQATMLSAGAWVLGVVVSMILTPLFPVPSEVSLASYLVVAGVAVGVAVIASVASARRTLSIDPALAFAGA